LGGFLFALAVSFGMLLLLGLGVKKALFGFFYFLLTPFLAIVHFPLAAIVLVILFLLFRRVGSCMRQRWRWVAYALLFLHWVAFGFYCSSYI